MRWQIIEYNKIYWRIHAHFGLLMHRQPPSFSTLYTSLASGCVDLSPKSFQLIRQLLYFAIHYQHQYFVRLKLLKVACHIGSRIGVACSNFHGICLYPAATKFLSDVFLFSLSSCCRSIDSNCQRNCQFTISLPITPLKSMYNMQSNYLS